MDASEYRSLEKVCLLSYHLFDAGNTQFVRRTLEMTRPEIQSPFFRDPVHIFKILTRRHGCLRIQVSRKSMPIVIPFVRRGEYTIRSPHPGNDTPRNSEPVLP